MALQLDWTQRLFYGLGEGEEILYSEECDSVFQYRMGEVFNRRNNVKPSEQQIASEMERIHKQLGEDARRIERGPVLPYGTTVQELQGEYQDLRVAFLLNHITGEPEKGFVLIGKKRSNPIRASYDETMKAWDEAIAIDFGPRN